MSTTRSGRLADLSPAGLTNGVVGFIFAATGPVALVLAALSRGGLGEADIASWLFGGFVINGLFTLAFSWHFRQPLVFLWSIPGTVLVGQALTHMSYAEVIGAYVATGALMLVLGLTGVVNRAMSAVPMPVVTAMVAGVFMQFGIDWLHAFGTDFWIAAPMTAVFFAMTAVPAAARAVPPIIVALAVGIAATVMLGAVTPGPPMSFALAAPKLTMPVFSWAAMIELVVPLAITVLVVQNGQGIAVLTAAGHKPPVDTSATACGIGAMLTGVVGTVPTCLAGAVMAILVSGDARERHYAAGMVLGSLGIAYGLCAPMIARLALAAPKALIATLAGLAMLRVLQGAFAASFNGAYQLSALITFLITVSGVTILNIGAPFWGIVLGWLASRVLEREG